MINDLRATPRGLFVAAAEGLFVSRDGRTFQREARVRELGRDPTAWGLRLYDDGGLLLFGTQQGLALADGTGSATKGTAPAAAWAPHLPDARVHALLRTRGGLWVGTECGLALLDLAAPRPASPSPEK